MGKIQKMVDYAKSIAKDDSHGYSQTRRWPSQGTDFDCSSLMYQAAQHAGYNVTVGPSGTHYTGTMLDDFQRAGFKLQRFDGNLADLDPGDILVRDPWGEGGHTEMYIGNGKFVNAYGNWDYVLTPPSESKPKPSTQWPNGVYVVAIAKVGIRAKRSTASTLCCTAAKGAKLKLKDLKPNKAGNVWGMIAAGDHKGRYVMVYSAAKKTNRLKFDAP